MLRGAYLFKKKTYPAREKEQQPLIQPATLKTRSVEPFERKRVFEEDKDKENLEVFKGVKRMSGTTASQIEVQIKNFYDDIFTGDKLYFMPKYQRPYSWETKQIEDFWNDMLFALEQNTALPYLMGSIYLAKVDIGQLKNHVNEEVLINNAIVEDGKELYLVIDGQQRITTLFLFLLSLADSGIKSNLFTSGSPKLHPGIIDFGYFGSLVKGLPATPSTRSNKRLFESYSFFTRRLESFEKKEELKAFVLNNLHLVKVTVEKNLELMTTLFVSQTDRGKRLTNLEKFKSTLMFYSQKIDKTPEEDTEIDNLFGNLFERIESLCSLKIYSKPEQAEADVLRILNFMLLKGEFYRIYLNDLLKDESDKDERKVEIWHEAGEDRIYEAVSKVFRESLGIRRDNIKEIIPYLITRIREIYDFYDYLVISANKEKTGAFKDNYDGATWYPFKQLFSVLGLSVFSKALLVELHKAGKENHTDPYAYILPKHGDLTNIDILGKIEEIKHRYDKLSAFMQSEPANMQKDIEAIRQVDSLKIFFNDRLSTILNEIGAFQKYTSKGLSPLNLIEENELAIWTINKRPVGNFIWWSDKLNEILEHVRNFSFWYKRDYMLRDLGYGNYKYILFEYERLTQDYSDSELAQILDYDVDEDDGIMIQREHIFAQNAVNHDQVKDIWLKTTNENYDDWIWRIGNIALLEHNINIAGAGNKTVWDKAAAYQDSAFKGTRALGRGILELKGLCERLNLNEEQTLLAFKILFEMRELELLAFTFYRFA